MALTKLMKDAYPNIVTLTVDHQLRPESRMEAEQVAAWMEKWRIPHTILTWQEPSLQRLQERARYVRYQLMGDWCQKNGVATLMTAHHQDDVIETFWMRVMKGSGPAGLCGIAAERLMSFGRLIRPLLSISRNDLRQTLEGHAYIDDPSNDNTKFERVRCRQWLHDHPEQRAAALRSILQFQQTEAFIQMHLQRSYADCVCENNVQPGWISLPPLISQRLWQKMVREIGANPYPMSHDLCVRVDNTLRSGKAINAGGVWLRPNRNGVTVMVEPKRRRQPQAPLNANQPSLF